MKAKGRTLSGPALRLTRGRNLRQRAACVRAAACDRRSRALLAQTHQKQRDIRPPIFLSPGNCPRNFHSRTVWIDRPRTFLRELFEGNQPEGGGSRFASLSCIAVSLSRATEGPVQSGSAAAEFSKLEKT